MQLVLTPRGASPAPPHFLADAGRWRVPPGAFSFRAALAAEKGQLHKGRLLSEAASPPGALRVCGESLICALGRARPELVRCGRRAAPALGVSVHTRKVGFQTFLSPQQGLAD